MGWEDRNGRSYYYRKQRIGAQVVSKYIGAGWLAEIYAAADEQIRTENELERKALNKEKAEIMAIDREVNDTMDTCRALADVFLLVSGFHTHKGTWRRKRGG